MTESMMRQPTGGRSVFAQQGRSSGNIENAGVVGARGKRGSVLHRNGMRAFVFLLNLAKGLTLMTPATSNHVVRQTPTEACSPDLQLNHPAPDTPGPSSAGLLDKAAGAQMNRLKVLITDDSKTLRDRIAEMLTQVAGLEIVGAVATVSETLAAIHVHRPDVLVLDLQIGNNNGIEILRATKIVYPRVKVIVFTNQIERQYRERCVDLGAEHFLCKSTESNVLIQIISRLTVFERPQ